MSHVDLTFHSNQHLLTLGTRKLNQSVKPHVTDTVFIMTAKLNSEISFHNLSLSALLWHCVG